MSLPTGRAPKQAPVVLVTRAALRLRHQMDLMPAQRGQLPDLPATRFRVRRMLALGRSRRRVPLEWVLKRVQAKLGRECRPVPMVPARAQLPVRPHLRVTGSARHVKVGMSVKGPSFTNATRPETRGSRPIVGVKRAVLPVRQLEPAGSVIQAMCNASGTSFRSAVCRASSRRVRPVNLLRCAARRRNPAHQGSATRGSSRARTACSVAVKPT
jgi:hypothetical protein